MKDKITLFFLTLICILALIGIWRVATWKPKLHAPSEVRQTPETVTSTSQTKRAVPVQPVSVQPHREASPPPSPPSTITGKDGAPMTLIPAGEFQMGGDNGQATEKPVHTVYLDAFYLDRYEVTVGQYKKFVEATGHGAPDWRVEKYAPTDEHPIIYVSWYDAATYAQWARKRLPTEAEWEKAARGGLKGKQYPWGDSIDESQANYTPNAGKTTPVGAYPPNDYGLYDMGGNVWEWCMDKWDSDFYASSPKNNPVAGGMIPFRRNYFTSVKTVRVLRGGSWNDGPGLVRVATRIFNHPSRTSCLIGFRCAKSVTP